MDSIAPSRRIHASKKGNKENTQPAHGSKGLIKRDKASAAPFQHTGNKKEETEDPPKVKPAGLTSASSAAVKKATAVRSDGKRGPAAEIQRQTHSRAFLAEQAAKIKKLSAEAPKPPAAVAPVKAAPGLYKGRIIQSKIGSIWKSSSSLNGPDPKPPAARTESARVGIGAKSRSKSVSEVPARATRQPAATRSKSAFDKRTQVTKPAAGSRPAAALSSARPPARAVPPTKPKVAVTDRKVSKPPASSSLSQYRLNMETAEERRTKLAEWLASKGKTLKRPAMAASAAPAKNKTAARHEADPKPQSGRGDEAQLAANGGCGPEPSLDAHVLDSAAPAAAPPAAPPAAAPPAAPHCTDTQEEELPPPSTTPLVMEASLQLLEVSDLDPHEGMEDIVVNLCHALEAMETPSGCSDDCLQVTDESSEPEEAKDEKSEEEGDENVHTEGDGDDDDEEEGGESDDEGVKASHAEQASMIKYSIKTTPYLQSVKKTLEDEAGASSSRKRINIGDLKFVTPVRRSSRIQRTSSRLPAMLQDHDPSVSSLAELLTMDDDPNAFICRRNAALLDELPADDRPLPRL